MKVNGLLKIGTVIRHNKEFWIVISAKVDPGSIFAEGWYRHVVENLLTGDLDVMYENKLKRAKFIAPNCKKFEEKYAEYLV